MNMKLIYHLSLMAAIAITSLGASATNIHADQARFTANSFIKQQTANPTLRSVTMADLKLVHAEPSVAAPTANSYYAFNITGGGYVIVAGEDRATPVLGYSDRGHLDFNNLPEGLKALLDSYREEIEYLQAHPSLKATPAPRNSGQGGVAPLIPSMWGQEMPYNLQCPIYQGEYCVVGCVATAMTQVMHYWRYPTSSPAISAYYCYDIGQTLPELPETNFNYNLMLNSYCHWDYEQSALIQDTYTDEQAQEVAKLARYCGQAVHMGYSPEGSGAYVSNQLSAMQTFGYTDAEDVSRSSWWSDNYTDAEWEAMIKTELDAGRPILYSANDYAAGGHAFVCDGYDDQGMFHFNFGWYGTCNGWYASTALNMTHRDGDELHFNYDHEMLINLEPSDYCVINVDGLTVPEGLLILGENMSIGATNVSIRTTHPNLNLLFSLCTDTGRRLASSNALNINLANFEQGSNVEATLKLPATLEQGHYDLKMLYYISLPRFAETINVDAGELNVVGHVAKYNAPFSVEDVTTLISYLLKGTHEGLNIADVTTLINAILAGQ